MNIFYIYRSDIPNKTKYMLFAFYGVIIGVIYWIFESGKNLDINFLVKKMDEMKMTKMDMENDSQCSDMDMGEMKMGNMMINIFKRNEFFHGYILTK